MTTSPSAAQVTPIRSTMTCAICGSHRLTPSSLHCRAFSAAIPGLVEVSDRGVFQDPEGETLEQAPLIQLDLTCENGHQTWFSWHATPDATIAEQGVINYDDNQGESPADHDVSPEDRLLRVVYQEFEGCSSWELPGFITRLDLCILGILHARNGAAISAVEIRFQIDVALAQAVIQDLKQRRYLATWMRLSNDEAKKSIMAAWDRLVQRGLARLGEHPWFLEMDSQQAARAGALVAMGV